MTILRKQQLVGRLVSRSVCRSGWSIGSSVFGFVVQSVGLSVCRSVGMSVWRSVSRSVSRLVRRSICQFVVRSVGWVGRSVDRVFNRFSGRSVCQVVGHSFHLMVGLWVCRCLRRSVIYLLISMLQFDIPVVDGVVDKSV